MKLMVFIKQLQLMNQTLNSVYTVTVTPSERSIGRESSFRGEKKKQ